MGTGDRTFYRLLLFLVILALPQPALASKPIIVGDGTMASCTEAALKQALLVAETVGGGTIRFNCGAAPATIALSDVIETGERPALLVLPTNTTIDGGGLITLDGTRSGMVALVRSGATAAFRRVTIAHGLGPIVPPHFNRTPGGIANFGALTITQSVVSDNLGTLGASLGGILNIGILTIRDSVISNNGGEDVGGVLNEGTLKIRNTAFVGNVSVANDAGGIFNTGTLEIADSAFSGNRAPDGSGGAIYNTGTLTAKGTLFQQNVGAYSGGAIWSAGTLNIKHSEFIDNVVLHAIGQGGAGIAGSGALVVSHSTFSGNRSPIHGGGILNFGTLTVRHSVFSENEAGAIFEGSRVFGDGGAIYNGGGLALVGSTLLNNVARQGGGLLTTGALSVKDSTITHNRASIAGGGIYVDTSGTLTLKNTIVTDNTPDDIFP